MGKLWKHIMIQSVIFHCHGWLLYQRPKGQLEIIWVNYNMTYQRGNPWTMAEAFPDLTKRGTQHAKLEEETSVSARFLVDVSPSTVVASHQSGHWLSAQRTRVNYNELTTSSLEIIVSKGNHPQMALILVSELL